MRIAQLMSQPAITCRSSDTLNTAAGLMWEEDCGVLPVVDEAGHLVGMVTDRDICMAAYTQGKPLQDICVSGVMATQVFSCYAQEFVDAAERLMSKMQIRRLPIVDEDNRPVGVLSINDLARNATSPESGIDLSHGLVQTLAAIGKPRARPPQFVRVTAEEPMPADSPEPMAAGGPASRPTDSPEPMPTGM
jgi:CBS domain-containing protein